MSFRKRNVALGASNSSASPSSSAAKAALPGVRPSTLDGRPVTSTGTATLDGLLAGHGGLSLGCSLLIEEDGTTDYAGALLKFYAAEGLLQAHHVHVIGVPDQWGRELPGAVGESEKKDKQSETSDKMKIAWRYESLGQFGTATGARDSSRTQSKSKPEETHTQGGATPFNHTFDLSKRLVHPASSQMSFYPLSPHPSQPTFSTVLGNLRSTITGSQPSTVHRLIVPSLLSPALYPPHACDPTHLLPFLHALRSLLSTNRLTILTSLPTSLHPRSSGLTRFIELLHDGVLELSPFPHSAVQITQPTTGPTEEPPQGLLKIHKLPILHERGSGLAGYEEDWTFTLSRRRLTVKPFSLPPAEGDQEAQEGHPPGDEKVGREKRIGKGNGDMEF